MNLVQNRLTIDSEAITKASAVCEYNIGAEIVIAADEVAQPTVYKYVKAAAALTKNVPYVLVQTADGIETATPATSTVTKLIGIPQVDIPADYYGFVAIEGPCLAATGIQAAGDTLEVLTGGTTLTVDGSTGSPAETAATVAVSAEAASAAATVKVVLLGKRVTIAAS